MQWVYRTRSIHHIFITITVIEYQGTWDITKQQFSDPLHMLAWAKGIKTMYYCHAEGAKTSIAASGAPLNQMQSHYRLPIHVRLRG